MIEHIALVALAILFAGATWLWRREVINHNDDLKFALSMEKGLQEGIDKLYNRNVELNGEINNLTYGTLAKTLGESNYKLYQAKARIEGLEAEADARNEGFFEMADGFDQEVRSYEDTIVGLRSSIEQYVEEASALEAEIASLKETGLLPPA